MGILKPSTSKSWALDNVHGVYFRKRKIRLRKYQQKIKSKIVRNTIWFAKTNC